MFTPPFHHRPHKAQAKAVPYFYVLKPIALSCIVEAMKRTKFRCKVCGKLTTGRKPEGGDPVPAALIALAAWQRAVGVSGVTTLRWRWKGWLNPVNISGKLYLTAGDIAQFLKRAESGEFSRPSTGAAVRKPEVPA